VTRKITRAVARIRAGLEERLYLGNMNAMRDWGHAKDYVVMQWMMLQQDEPVDYVIATGEQFSVRQFVDAAAAELKMTIRWEGEGVDEIGVVATAEPIEGGVPTEQLIGRTIVSVDPRYFRPTEVETLLGDPSRARDELGWAPRIPFADLVAEMVRDDLGQARKDALLEREGFSVFHGREL
jgi:GDPmannose 4,6-dehydratase